MCRSERRRSAALGGPLFISLHCRGARHHLTEAKILDSCSQLGRTSSPRHTADGTSHCIDAASGVYLSVLLMRTNFT